ncbi:MAG: stage III sporulation protein AF [Tepidanaerobacter acetatoxydans]|uniref:stage III sporulation protein AF n=1 Tax=Tepidanaerobacter TaxID=499228 RepID=UPI000A850B5E|nr:MULTISPECIES: stage III sporulation protein AF [Tepidanaerobacter]NLU11432.1 stage III sporulation protein AF [Tepidanaerobacter acetatoxydans]
MIDAISLWIKQIVLVVMFTTFVDFLIPENKFLKYIKVFLGLLVMLAIINPLLQIFQKDIHSTAITLAFEDFVDKNTIKYNANIMNKKNNELAINKYKDKVEKHLTQEIKNISIYDVKNVRIAIDEDDSDENFGRITQLSVVLVKEPDKKNESKKEKISVETIKIGYDKSEKENIDIEREQKNNEVENIKEYLHITFGIPKENIHINLEE